MKITRTRTLVRSAASLLVCVFFLVGCGGSSTEREAELDEHPASAEDPTTGAKMAMLDGEFSRAGIENYERRLQQLVDRCSQTEMEIADTTVATVNYLDERAITETNLSLLEGAIRLVPPNETAADCAEALATVGAAALNR